MRESRREDPRLVLPKDIFKKGRAEYNDTDGEWQRQVAPDVMRYLNQFTDREEWRAALDRVLKAVPVEDEEVRNYVTELMLRELLEERMFAQMKKIVG